MQDKDNNIFKDSNFDYYMKRPDNKIFETINYMEYFEEYEVIVKNSLKNKKLKSADINIKPLSKKFQLWNLIFNFKIFKTTIKKKKHKKIEISDDRMGIKLKNLRIDRT